MPSKPNPIAEQNLIFAGLGLQLGILSKDKVIRAFTEWLFDKSKPLADILIQQKALSSEEANSLKVAVQAHIQKEGDQEKALASLHVVKDLESDLDHLGDNELHQTFDSALIKRKELCLDEQFTRSRILEQSDQDNLFKFDGPDTKAKDRFERQHFFDAGNLGELYFAKDTELNRTVVTKYIKPERANESLTQALFHLEGEVTGALEHPSIVPVYGLGKDTKGRLFYAMRYIRGRKLSRVIGEYHTILKTEPGRKQEALIDLLQYFQSACLAIEYAHKKGVLHCDIKPDNIMIGDYGEVFVVDWGLVVVHGEVATQGSGNEDAFATLDIGQIPPYKPSNTASSGLHRNQGGSRRGVGGTPAYMAPEQLRATFDDDVSLIGPGSDIYALGGVLFQILTGKSPHLSKKNAKESMEDFNNRILKGDFPKPTELKPETPKALESIALKALKLYPEDRYVSARDLADDVKRYMADEPVKAHQEGVVEKSMRFARKNRTVVGVAAALLVCLAFGGTLFGFITKGFNEKLQGFNEKLQVSEKEANENAVLAKKNEAQAYAQKEATEKQLYINKIQRAQSEFHFGETWVARNQLISIPFSQRGWEHDFLETLMNQNQITLGGHANGVNRVCFSQDGKKIASASRDRTIKLWDAITGQEIHTLKGHTDRVHCVSFSPDGKRIASCGWDRTIKLWDATTGQEIQTLKGHLQFATSVSFSPDGKRIVSSGWDATIKLWDAITGQEIRTLKGHTNGVNSVSFSPDGKHIASGSADRTIKLWDAATGLEILTLKGHTSEVNSVSFSPDGKQLASGSWDRTIKLWDAKTGQEIRTLKGHAGWVSGVTFSPNGRRIASSGWETTIKLWDAASGQEIRTLKGHSSEVHSVSFSPDGKHIASGSWDNTIKLWNATPSEEAFNLTGHKHWVLSVSLSSDGKHIASGSADRTIKLWDAKTGQGTLTLNGHSDWVINVSFSPDGKHIASGSADETIKLWDAITGQEIHTLKGHTNSVTSVSFSPDGKCIVSGSKDKTIKLWDANTGLEIRTLKGHTSEVNSVSFSPNGKQLASGSWDRTIKLWDAATGQETITLKGHTSEVNSVSFSPDGKRIVSGSYDNTIKLWNTTSGMELLTLKGHRSTVFSVSFSPDGNRIASGSEDNTIKLWDATTGQETITLKGHANVVTSVRFSPNGKCLVSGSHDTTINIWNATFSQEILNFTRNTNYVSSVTFSPEGKRFANGSDDKTVKLWDAPTVHKSFFLGGNENNFTQVGFSPDGRRIVSNDVNKNIKVWDVESGDEIQVTEAELKAYKTVSLSSVSADKAWSVEVDGSDVILINNKLREDRIARDKAFLTKLAQPDLKWHSQNAEESENNKQWFAAAFHLRKLLEIEPNNEEAKKRLQVAETNLKESK